MLRIPNGIYKCGRSTVREGYLIKMKRFVDDEATVIDTEELMHNLNRAYEDNFGNSRRSTIRSNLVPSGMLGNLVVVGRDGTSFKIGSGFTEIQRREMWAGRSDLVGSLVKYKYLNHGVKNKPRCPIFLGMRPINDVG